MQIQISWLLQKPTDLDLHCLLNWVYPGSAGQGLKLIQVLFSSTTKIINSNITLSGSIIPDLWEPCNITFFIVLFNLTLTSPWANSADNKLVIFFLFFPYFSQLTGFDISCKLSPLETICMKYQIQFSGKNKEKISKCCLLKILPRELSVKHRSHFSYPTNSPYTLQGKINRKNNFLSCDLSFYFKSQHNML